MSVKTYRNIEAKAKFFGLEVGDWAALATTLAILSRLSPSFLFNLGLVSALWAWMYFIKAKRPPGYTQSWLLFHLALPRALLVEIEPLVVRLRSPQEGTIVCP
ncbi:MAG: hypothetical protein AAB037_01320 [Chloroflexota bacterium]